MSTKEGVVRWGSLSTAKIARNAVVPAAAGADNAEFTAVASRDASTAQSFATDLGLPKHYGGYQQLLDDPDIDAVYNALPNSMHCEWTIKAAEAGKHVLCEKPLSDDEAQAREMASACEENGVLLMEAFMYRFSPRFRRVRELIDGDSIGRALLVRANFSFNLRGSGNWRLGTGLAGGALADVGCYCVSVSRLIFESDPKGVYSHLEIDPKLGVDMSGVVILEFTEQRRALIDFSFDMGGRQGVEIVGTKGNILVPMCFLPPADVPMPIEIKVGSESTVEEIPFANSYTLQLEELSSAILSGNRAPITPEDSIANTRVIDAIRESSDSGRLVGIRPSADA